MSRSHWESIDARLKLQRKKAIRAIQCLTPKMSVTTKTRNATSVGHSRLLASRRPSCRRQAMRVQTPTSSTITSRTGTVDLLKKDWSRVNVVPETASTMLGKIVPIKIKRVAPTSSRLFIRKVPSREAKALTSLLLLRSL